VYASLKNGKATALCRGCTCQCFSICSIEFARSKSLS
jgi:hypothetical protein